MSLTGLPGTIMVADDRVLQVHKHLTRIGDVVIVDDIGEHVDRRNRDTGRIDDVHALLNGVLGAPLLDLGLERGVVLAAVDVGVKARILEQLGAVERLGAQEREELVVAAADDEASVAGLEGVIREGGGVAVAISSGCLPEAKKRCQPTSRLETTESTSATSTRWPRPVTVRA